MSDWIGNTGDAFEGPRPGVWKSFRATISGVDHPRFLASGFTLGLMLGFLPKSSLLVVLFFLLLMLSRSNLTTGMFGFCIGMGLLPLLAPLFSDVGMWLGSQASLQTTWVELHRLPLVPWFQLQNSIVLGSLTCSLLGCIPMYFFAKIFFNWFRPLLVKTFGGPSPSN